MIKRIDEMLKLWAQDLHSPVPDGAGGPSGGNMIAMLMECKGELIRGTRGSRVLLDESADIELIVNKHGARASPSGDGALLQSRASSHRKCFIAVAARRPITNRLHDAHVSIAGMLMGKAA